MNTKAAPKPVPPSILKMVPEISSSMEKIHIEVSSIRAEAITRTSTLETIESAVKQLQAHYTAIRAEHSQVKPVRELVQSISTFTNVISSLKDAIEVETPIDNEEFKNFKHSLANHYRNVVECMNRTNVSSFAEATEDATTGDPELDQELSDASARESYEDAKATREISAVNDLKKYERDAIKQAPKETAKATMSILPVMFKSARLPDVSKLEAAGFDTTAVTGGGVALLHQDLLAVRSENLRTKQLTIAERELLLMLKTLKGKTSKMDEQELLRGIRKTRPKFSMADLKAAIRLADKELKGDIPEDSFVHDLITAISDKEGTRYHLVVDSARYHKSTGCNYYWIMPSKRLTSFTKIVGGVENWQLPF